MSEWLEIVVVAALWWLYGYKCGRDDERKNKKRRPAMKLECSHSWRFWGDDPYIVCDHCNELRDALTGKIIRKAVRSET